MQWYLAPLKKYAVFSGRAHRTEMWTFALVNVAIYFVLGTAYNISQAKALSYAIAVLALALIIPMIAVAVRRLHDTDRSGAWYFISFIPIVGGIWLLILLLGAGTPGTNRYGPQPS